MSRRYGATPLHLVGHAAAFALAAYALVHVLSGGAAANFVVWFLAAAVLHDLLLLPLYSGADRLLGRRLRTTRVGVNYIRVPALVSGLLLLVYFPLILGLSDDRYFRATGHHVHGYARNWLLITAGLYAASALVYLVRRSRG